MPPVKGSSVRAGFSRTLRGSQVSCSDAFEGSTTTTLSDAASVAIHRHIIRLFRQISTKQQKQRLAVMAEEQHEIDDIICMHQMEVSSIAIFKAYREQREVEEDRKKRFSSIWMKWSTGEHLAHLVDKEEQVRHQLQLREARMRVTLMKLCKIEEEPLMWQHALSMVVLGEIVRRVAFYRQELEAAMSLNIPGYDPEVLTVEGISDKKVDWMKNVCCPFRYADDCPFFPSHVIQSLRDPTFMPACVMHQQAGSSAVDRVADGAADRTRSAALSDGSRCPAANANLPPLTRANKIAIKSALNQGHYRKSQCSLLPLL